MITEGAQYKQARDMFMAKMKQTAPPGAWDRYNAVMAHYKATGRPWGAQANARRPTDRERAERQQIIREANVNLVCIRMDVESRLQGWE